MPAKRKAEVETRTACEIEIANISGQIQQLEAQIKFCTESLTELSNHTAKIKQLEVDLLPREADYKTILTNFNKLLEGACSIKSKSAEGENKDVGHGSRPGSSAAERASRPASRLKGDDRDGSMLAPEQEQLDRERTKLLQHVIRENLHSILIPVFNMPKTERELAIEKEKEHARQEAARLAADGAPAAGQTKPPSAHAPRGKGVKGVAALDTKVDLHLLCPPGIESMVFDEVLRLRGQRLKSEAALQVLQNQLNNSRQIVAQRREEGVSRPALRKHEKRLQQLSRMLVDLQRRKTEEDAVKARQLELAAAEKGKKKR